MKASRQQESQSQGLAPALTCFSGAAGRHTSPDFISRGRGGEGAPMNQVNQRGQSGLLLRTEEQSPRALRKQQQRGKSGGRQHPAKTPALPTGTESHSQKGGPQQRQPRSDAFHSHCHAGGSAIRCPAGPQGLPGTRVRALRATPGHRAGSRGEEGC